MASFGPAQGTTLSTLVALGLSSSDTPTFTGVTTTGANASGGATTMTGAGTTATAVLRIGGSATEGWEVKVINEVVTLTNAVSGALTAGAIPAGAVVLCVQGNLDSAVAGDASGDDLLAKVGIGISSDKVKYGVTSGLTKNLKIDTIPAYAVNAGETILIYAIKADGATACTEKFVAGGLVRVRIVYAVCNSLDDAA